MKRYILIIIAAVSTAMSVSAQTTAEEYNERYLLLYNKLGATGVGIETLVERWEKDFPDDHNMLIAKFMYYYNKSQSMSAVSKDQDKFMGNEPFLTLKDSLDNPVNYFQEVIYDEEMYSTATRAIDKAIQQTPDDLNLQLNRIAALMSYEKEHPDMTTAELISLAEFNASRHPLWQYQGEFVDEDFFCTAVQEYCTALYAIGSKDSYDSFLAVSQKMNEYFPESTFFIDNIGTYYLVAQHDYKKALKYYNKVLKLEPEDYVAIKNSVIAAKSEGNAKLEKKYLEMLSKYAPEESERKSAEVKLKSLK